MTQNFYVILLTKPHTITFILQIIYKALNEPSVWSSKIPRVETRLGNKAEMSFYFSDYP